MGAPASASPGVGLLPEPTPAPLRSCVSRRSLSELARASLRSCAGERGLGRPYPALRGGPRGAPARAYEVFHAALLHQGGVLTSVQGRNHTAVIGLAGHDSDYVCLRMPTLGRINLSQNGYGPNNKPYSIEIHIYTYSFGIQRLHVDSADFLAQQLFSTK